MVNVFFRVFYLFYAVVSTLNYNADDELTCLNDKGIGEEWFFLYKLPEAHHTNEDQVKSGKAYASIYSSNPQEWNFPTSEIDDVNSPLRATLSQALIVNPDEYTTLLLYNDQKDTGKETHQNEPENLLEQKHGHMKGILAYDRRGHGFWMVHSIPRFPMFNASYWQYPNTAENYGQSILCISLVNSETVLDLFAYANPQYIKKQFGLHSRHSNGNQSSGQISVVLTTNKNTKIRAFAKSFDENIDIYSNLVASYLNADLYVETWRHGPDPGMPSICDGDRHMVINVNNVTILGKNFTFRYTSDHSKWAVSSKGNYFCVGDLNRQVKQILRGGTCLCLRNAQLHSLMNQSVAELDTCPRNVKKSESNTLMDISKYMLAFILFACLVNILNMHD
ncbi:hypothetical protein GJ496_010831 [Pomphorhynchus laevis]|nr:hypothetical protein GJ496_010831 [Pomphorhynchus laevis]